MGDLREAEGEGGEVVAAVADEAGEVVGVEFMGIGGFVHAVRSLEEAGEVGRHCGFLFGRVVGGFVAGLNLICLEFLVVCL